MKFLAKIIIIIAVFFGGFYFGQQQALSPSNGLSTERQQVGEEILVNLMLDFGSGEVKAYNQVSLLENDAVFKLLEKVTAENDIEFEYKDYGGELGVFIKSIDGVENNFAADKFWQYWVNNEYAQIGASQYLLADGDVVEWKYIKGQIN